MSNVSAQAYRISPEQSRLWTLQQSSSAYWTQAAIHIEGSLDVAALKTAFAGVVDRLEILRTTFRRQAGLRVPLQVIADAEQLPWREVDWSGRQPSQIEASIEELLRDEREGCSAGLDTRPLLRLSLARVSAQRHYLIVSLPALCADALSLTNLFEEVVKGYVGGEAVGDQPEPLQYADFAEWHYELLAGDQQSPAQTYWREQQLGASQLTTIHPVAKGKPQGKLDVASFAAPLDRETALAVASLAREKDVPVSDVYLACWQTLVWRLSGQPDVVTGAVADERGHDMLQGACGLFSMTLPVRHRFEENMRFDEVLDSVVKSRRAASAWQYDFSWERHLEGGGNSSGNSSEPGFFPLAFQFHALPSRRDVGAVSFSIARTVSCTDRFHVKLNCVQSADGVGFEWQSDSNVLPVQELDRLSCHYRTIVRSAVDNPRASVLDLDVLDEAQREEIVVGFNDSKGDLPIDRCVHECFEDVARRDPDRTALVYEQQALTYGELNARCNQLAHYLRSLGVGPDVPVALCVERSLDMIVGILGALKAGGAYVPLDPTLPSQRLALLLEESRTPVVVCQPHLAELFPECRATLVVLDADTRRAIARESGEDCRSGVAPASLVYTLFTSGSTGTPKGVLVEHRQLINYVQGVLERLQLPRDVSFATVSSYAADLGNTAIFPALLSGGCLHIVAQDRLLDPDAMAAYGERRGVDCLKIVPSHLAALLSAPRPERLLPRRCLVFGGEASTWELVSRVETLSAGCQIVNHYGPTEATVGVLAYRHDRGHRRADAGDTVPLGRPLSNSQVYLLDSRTRPVPIGVVGELHIGGAGLARGYVNRPDQTAAAFVPNPCGADPGARMYRTGDRARYLADGNVEFLGRADHQVKIRGFRVELGEIESVLGQHASVEAAIVLAREDAPGDKRLVGYAVRRRDAQATTDDLRDYVRGRLPEYMVPSAFVLLDHLPLNRNGKVDRGALPAVTQITEPRTRSRVPPRTKNEETLLEIWSEVLGNRVLSVHDDFFESGGHSLLAMRLVTRVREAFNVDLPLPSLFDTPTVAGLAESIEALIGAGASGASSAIERVPRDGNLPLSFAQQRLWFLDQLEPQSSAYNRTFAFRLTGPLNLESFEQSLREIVRRHEVLRTTYPTVDGEARQVIARAGLAVSLLNLGHLRPKARDDAARRLAAVDAHRPFDLARGPLVRACLMRLNETDHVLLLSQHHVNTDAWSNDVLANEVSKGYEAFSNGLPSPLADLSIQYADFAAWQREWLEGETLQKQVSFWKEELKSAPPSLELPTDRPRPAVPRFRGASRTFHISRSLSESLKELSQRESATLFMTLLAAFQTLLHRYTGQPDILVGSPIAGRMRPEVQGLIGFFVNTLVLRADLRGAPRFRDLLSQVRERSLAAYAHQDLPFEKLVDELALERDLSRTPLFQVMFVFQTNALESLRLPEITVTQLPTPIETAKFNLTLYMSDMNQGLDGTLEYDTDLFDHSTIERLLGHFETLLEGIVADPQRPVSELPLLNDAERRRLLVEWNDTEADYPKSECLHELIEAQVQKAPDAVALVFEEQQLTYGELNRKANQLARHLRSLGVGPEVRVGLCLNRSPQMVVGALAVLKAGGAYVPMDPAYPVDRLGFMLQDSRATVLLSEERLAASLPAHSARVVCLDSELRIVAGERSGNLCPSGGAQNLSHVIYTSGSTGRPKGVAIEQRSVVTLVHWSREHYTPEDLAGVLAATSICFDLSVWELFVTLSAGGTVILAPTALDLPALKSAHRVTLVNTVPSAIAELLRTGGIPSSVRTVNLAGEPLTSELSDALYDLGSIENVCDLYGPSEDTTYSTYARRARGGRATIGRPLANTRVYLGETGQAPVPIGVRGELHLAGAGLARGYLDRPDLTAERFLPDALGWTPGVRVYRTGDSARWHAEGTLDFLGRLDHQVKIRGFRIELGEIESVLRQHAGVRDAIVLAREDQPGVKRLVAYFTTAGEVPPTVSELRDHLRDRLPGYMVPAAFVTLDAVPLLPNGKVDRRALPAPDQTRPELEEAFVEARNPIEQRLADIWRQVLGVERVGVRDNFFELGGDSILSIQIVSRANQAGLHLSARQIFEHQTIAELALVAGAAPAVHAAQGLVTGVAPLTAIQEWFFEQQFTDPHHFNQSLLLEVREALNPDWMRSAVESLIRQHDALRLRFVRGDGGWQQEDTTADSPTVFSRIDVSGLNEGEQRAALEAAAAGIQASLSLGAGPQLRVVLFDLGARGQRVLLVAHHLVVDGVSWRILLEDLQAAYDQASRGEGIHFPPKTTSYAAWADRCREHASSEAAQGELSYWLSESRSTAVRLPVDDPQGANTVASARSVTVSLSAAETEALLREVPDAYRTQINDVLLTAVTEGVAGWAGERSVLIDLEGHGREELFADVDVSRTVGWFTAMYPVLLQPESGEVASLKSIKEQLRRVPNRGIGYGLLRYLKGDPEARLAGLPQAEITFNYLGQTDQALPKSSRFRWAGESQGPTQSLRATRSHLLDVNGLISDGRLRLSVKFSENVHRRATIEQLADRILASLRTVIQHCQSPEAGGCTPSDFPLAGLDQAALDRLIGSDREIDDVYPLSPMQQGLLFHTLFEAEPGVYVEQFCCTVHGQLDFPRFQHAWQRMVDRHPALRTSFRHEGLRQPLQLVHRHVPIEWEHLDWRGHSEPERESMLDAFLEHDRRQGFDLSSPPLMRIAVVQMAEATYQIIWTYHHLLLDGWSVPVVLNEMLADYETVGDREQARLAPPRPYKDFIAWHGRQDLQAAERFWRRTLEGFKAPTPLTVDSALERQPAEVSAHKEHQIQLSKTSTEALRSFGRQHQVTLNTLVQGAWGLLLSRYSNQDDVLFGATVSGRPSSLAGVESMVGLFINTVPVRVRIPGDGSVVTWLQTLQAEQLEVRDYEYCPLGKVQAWSELPAGTPLFESLLVFENYPIDQALLRRNQALGIEKSRTIERTNYPLALIAVPGQELTLRVNYDGGRLDASSVARMLDHLKVLLEGMAGDPDRRVDDLPMLTAAEQQQLLVEWNDTRELHSGPSCVHQMFEEQAARTPDSVAVVFEDRALTYSALDGWANDLADRLVALDVRPNVLVGLFMERGPEMLAGILGVLKAGGAYVPLPRDYPRERLQFMLDDCGAKLVLTQERLRAELPAGSFAVQMVDGNGLRDARTPVTPRMGATPCDLAYVMYTSGSTGQPKGAMIEHRSAANYLAWCTRFYPLADGCGAPVQSSIGFDATITSLIAPLLTGRRVVLLPEAGEVEALGAALSSDSDFGLVKLTPAHLKMLVAMVPEAKAQGGTRSFVIGGEALLGSDVEFWRNHAPRTRLINEYGPTETVVGCCVYEVSERTPRSGAVSIGRPIDNTQLYVLGRRTHPMPVQAPGELYIGGAGLSRGYLNRPGLTAEKFVPNPFSEAPGERLYKTGDLVRHLPDDDLEFLGRIDHQVKLRGFRIELGEIEAVLSRHPKVRDAVVLAREDYGRGKRLVAYVTSGAQARPTVLELRNHLQGELPAYMVPAVFVTLDAMPLTANGKIDRRALPAPDGTRQELETPFAAGATEAEQQIATVWKEAIGVDKVGIDDNFFEAGGDSLLMIQVQWKLQTLFGRNVPLAQMFQNPTVRSLAASLSQSTLETNEATGKKSQARAETRLAAVKQRGRRRENRRPGEAD